MNITFKKYVGNDCDDGGTQSDMPGYEYMNLIVVVDGEADGSITGWFKPEVAAHLRKALRDSAADYDGAPYCSHGHPTKASCDCPPIAANE